MDLYLDTDLSLRYYYCRDFMVFTEWPGVLEFWHGLLLLKFVHFKISFILLLSSQFITAGRIYSLLATFTKCSVV